MSELKNCKNCGGTPIVLSMEIFGKTYYSVECHACMFFSNRKFKTKQQAIDYWNKGADNGYLLTEEEKYI